MIKDFENKSSNVFQEENWFGRSTVQDLRSGSSTRAPHDLSDFHFTLLG